MTGTLLDTHVLIAIIQNRLGVLGTATRNELRLASFVSYASVVSLWEIAIKNRLGKLPLEHSLNALPGLLRSYELRILVVQEEHVIATVEPDPPTRDPFDRLLLAQCQVEGMRLVTEDRALVGHRLAWRHG